jgi:hypothetical protein
MVLLDKILSSDVEWSARRALAGRSDRPPGHPFGDEPGQEAIVTKERL